MATGWRMEREANYAAVGAFVVLLLVTSATGVCPGYIPFGISTLRSGRARLDDASHSAG